MIERYKYFLLTVFVPLIIFALCYGLWAWTTSMGRDALIKIAGERNLCRQANCVDGLAFVEKIITEKYDVSIERLEWCLGVDDWRAARVHRGGLFKVILVDIMDTPCGFLKENQGEAPQN